MPPYIVVCLFEANRFAVARDAVGSSWMLEQDGRPVLASAPAPQACLSSVPASERHPLLNRAHVNPNTGIRYYDGATPDPAGPNHPPLARHLSLLEILVGFDRLLSATQDEDSRARSLRLGIETARAAAATFIDWVRAKHSHNWADVRAPTLAAEAALVDLAKGLPLGRDNPDASRRIILMSADSWLTDSSAAEIAQGIVRGDTPPLAEALLAEARHRLWPPATVIEATRATQLLFTACEVKAEQVVRPSRKQRSQGVMALFDSVADQQKGRSLAREDPALYASLDALKDDRNTVAHEGRAPGLTVEKARRHADTAACVIDWLESV